MTGHESENESLEKSKQKDSNTYNSSVKIASGYAMANSVTDSVRQAEIKYSKPDSYTGNRSLYDSGKAKKNAKINLFKNGQKVIDPYTGERLVLTKREAKASYGDDWTKHLAESDHIKPLEKIYEDTKGNVWNTTDDIKAAANSKNNISVTSRKNNNAKRSRTQQEYIEDEQYLKNKGVNITEEGKKRALYDAEIAERSINRQLNKATVKNMLETGNKAGMSGGISAGGTAITMSGVMNIVAVINGEKDINDAISDTLKDGGKAAVTGYALGSSLTVLGHFLEDSASDLIKNLMNSNVPGKIITAVQVTGGAIKRYANGETSIEECITEIGENGINLATIGCYSMCGQELIPIPVVGAAIGALVGTVVTSQCYNMLIGSLNQKEYEHQERLRVIEESKRVAEEAKKYRKQLESYFMASFHEYKKCFDDALLEMKISFQIDDADGVIESANQITRKLKGKVYYNNTEEFKNFLIDTQVDIL